MKVAIVTESPVDEAAIRVIAGAVLGTPALPIAKPGLRTRSWPGILHIIKAVYLDLYYQTDADGLILVADSDSSPLHEKQHESDPVPNPACRLCLMRKAIADAQRKTRPRPQASKLRTAVGLTVPEISAWYLQGLNPHVNETSWVNGMKNKKQPYTKQELKKEAFGTTYLPGKKAVEIAEKHAARIAGDLVSLEAAFPMGFGALLADLRRW